MYRGTAISLNTLDSGLVELVLDLQGSSVNKLDQLTLNELGEALQQLTEAGASVQGLLIRSAKPAFVVGADITEFTTLFKRPEAELLHWMSGVHEHFSRLENLPFPTVAAVNGFALGGGLELALAADCRVLAEDAKVGLPEVTLGICPGFGGTVRLSRLADLSAALEWMTSGKPQAAAKALKLGVADQVVPATELQDAALALLRALVNDPAASRANRQRKQQALANTPALQAQLEGLSASYTKTLDARYPAAGAIVALVSQHATQSFGTALEMEAQTFAQLAKTTASQSLIGLFLSDQSLKRKAKSWIAKADKVQQGAVLGAGIMGGGVAYQSALSGVPIIMKDIRDEALALGSKTASKALDKLIEKGRLDEAGKQQVLARIHPELEYQDFERVDLVVEAVVENPKIKAAVLSEVEGLMRPDAILTTNTSTISIDLLAKSLKRPELFCGMHFFNPVPLMPLVEVIRGSQSSEKTLATTLAYAVAMGKTPIVVKDCPGFLVNRVLFPYFNGFNRLLKDGVDFERIDRVMEAFGWPMGPAYLADVVGIDTMVHADQVLQVGFPNRMGHDGEPIMEALLAAGALGQKNGKGFYEYGVDAQGKRTKTPSAAAHALIAERVQAKPEVSDEDIIDRLMIPMCLESVRCLEEGIVDSAEEVDMGLILGLGFPRFRGGALRYIDHLGLAVFAQKAVKHSAHGGLYQLTSGFNTRLQNGQTYF